MDKEAIKQWIQENLVMQDEAREITEQSKSGFNQSVSTRNLLPFVEFGDLRKTRLYLREDCQQYNKTKRIRGKGRSNMKKFEDLNVTNSTIIEVNGKELRTTQDPYAADDETYRAHAVDEENNEYLIEWYVIDDETTDESEACDWDHPLSVKSITSNRKMTRMKKKEIVEKIRYAGGEEAGTFVDIWEEDGWPEETRIELHEIDGDKYYIAIDTSGCNYGIGVSGVIAVTEDYDEAVSAVIASSVDD